jgi:hypothetical protein
MEEVCVCRQPLGDTRRFLTNAKGQMGVMLCRDCANRWTTTRKLLKAAAAKRAARKAAKGTT